jgi:hypothetical protein
MSYLGTSFALVIGTIRLRIRIDLDDPTDVAEATSAERTQRTRRSVTRRIMRVDAR